MSKLDVMENNEQNVMGLRLKEMADFACAERGLVRVWQAAIFDSGGKGVRFQVIGRSITEPSERVKFYLSATQTRELTAIANRVTDAVVANSEDLPSANSANVKSAH